MIVVSVILLFFSFFTLFLSVDSLDFARGAMRVLLSLVFVISAYFSDSIVFEGGVFLFVVIQMALYSFVRMEVQVEDDRH